MPWSEHASGTGPRTFQSGGERRNRCWQPLLRDLVDYVTNAFVRCAEEVKKDPDGNLAVLILYIHLIEMTDGVQVLVSEACATPATPLLRSSFETLLAIKFILESNVREDYLLRSRSWLAYYAVSV